MNSPSDLLVAIRETKERDIAYCKRLDTFLEIASIAINAVYLSGHHGNVRCAEAIREIEKKLRLV